MLTSKQPNLESLTSINADGSRYFLHPADVRGRFTLFRRLFGVLLLAIYVLLPWIPIGGHPAVFLDLASRRFHFFGLTFLAQDLWIGFFLLTGLGFSLFYVTALFGRLWCGWACPYTVFLEHLYRRIERIVDGDSTARRRLADASWTSAKVVRRIVKHGLYILVSLLIAHVFLSYFVSLTRLYEFMKQSPRHHVGVFGVMLFLTGCLYFSFAWFREQFCIILCPYGRIQSALTDDDTVIIGYDRNRGEPRGKKSDPDAGDCIACSRCVHVCPTGIDIRNGLQLECIGCAGCIDACDEVMDKVGRPRGLIRYDSLNGLEQKRRRIWRPRVALYTGLLALGATVMGLFLSGLHSATMEIVRMPGQPYYFAENLIRNQYRVHLVTKRHEETSFTFEVAGLPEGAIVTGLDDLVLTAEKESVQTFIVQVPAAHFKGTFSIELTSTVGPSGEKLVDRIDFLGPSPYLLSNP